MEQASVPVVAVSIKSQFRPLARCQFHGCELYKLYQCDRKLSPTPSLSNIKGGKIILWNRLRCLWWQYPSNRSFGHWQDASSMGVSYTNYTSAIANFHQHQACQTLKVGKIILWNRLRCLWWQYPSNHSFGHWQDASSTGVSCTNYTSAIANFHQHQAYQTLKVEKSSCGTGFQPVGHTHPIIR